MFDRIIWNGSFRAICFWALVFGVPAAADLLSGSLDFSSVAKPVWTAIASAGSPEGDAALKDLSTPHFAMNLAAGLVALGAGFLVAYLVMHFALVRFGVRSVRKVVAGYDNKRAFSDAYENSVYPRLAKHPLVGQAWAAFDETLLKGARTEDGVISNTLRPQAFINFAMLREKLPGLKMLGSLSGYFVGVGLLLTFIGIVLALNTAGDPDNFKSTDAMQSAMVQLLNIASFKFSTSIAGLAVSIVFAIFARLIVISCEGSLSKFCDAVERQLRYIPPQSIAVEMNEVAKEQRDELKEINSDRYFTRLAESITPLLEQAVGRAMAPVSQQIGDAVGALSNTSQSGVTDLLKKFSESVQGGAGTELKQLASTLAETNAALQQTQKGLNGSGEDFSRKMVESAETLNRLVSEAGSRLEGSAETSRAALQEVVEAMRSSFERANVKVEEDLGNAATGASAKVEAAMNTVLERLDSQIGGLMSAMQTFQDESTKNVAATREQLGTLHAETATAVSKAGSEAAAALQAGLSDALAKINEEMGRFQVAMQAGSSAYVSQAQAISSATERTRETAEAFAGVATQVRNASAPLIQGGQSIASASADLRTAVEHSTDELQRAGSASSELAQALTEQVTRLNQTWDGYREQFDRVDQSLATAVGTLSDTTEAQFQRLVDHVNRLDGELAKVLGTLQPTVEAISGSAQDLSEIMDEWVRMQTRAAAE
jgi:ABC-type transporter Mla subunit MlaD